MAEKSNQSDPHSGIPTDANGKPIFYILPDGVRASYERKMKACEAAWLATRDPLVIDEAQTWAFLHRQPHPAWLHEAIGQLAVNRRGKAHAKHAIESTVRFLRYEAVRDAKASGLTWPRAYERAAEILQELTAAGEPSTMKAAYDAVKRDLREGRHGLYHVIKKRRSLPDQDEAQNSTNTSHDNPAWVRPSSK